MLRHSNKLSFLSELLDKITILSMLNLLYAKYLGGITRPLPCIIKLGRRFSPTCPTCDSARRGGRVSADNYSISSLYLCALGALKIFTTCPPSGRRVCVHLRPKMKSYTIKLSQQESCQSDAQRCFPIIVVTWRSFIKASFSAVWANLTQSSSMCQIFDI